ncbi:hypothetical protein STEG23_001529 [Scotinomys teguina]
MRKNRIFSPSLDAQFSLVKSVQQTCQGTRHHHRHRHPAPKFSGPTGQAAFSGKALQATVMSPEKHSHLQIQQYYYMDQKSDIKLYIASRRRVVRCITLYEDLYNALQVCFKLNHSCILPVAMSEEQQVATDFRVSAHQCARPRAPQYRSVSCYCRVRMFTAAIGPGVIYPSVVFDTVED